MLDMQTITQYVQDFGVVDFEVLDEDSIWFRGKDLTQVIIKTMKNKPVFTVWGGDDCGDVVDSTRLSDIDTLQAYLDEHAVTNKPENETAQTTQNIDTSMIDFYTNIIKEKLAEQQINLNFETQSKAERLVVRHIENKLAEIIQFLQ